MKKKILPTAMVFVLSIWSSHVSAAELRIGEDRTALIVNGNKITVKDGYHEIFGISPDGKTFITWSAGDKGNSSLHIRETSTGKVVRTVKFGPEYYLPVSKASWSPDGTLMTIHSADYYPRSFQEMKNGYLFTLDIGSGMVRNITDERSVKYLNPDNGAIYFNAYFSTDGKNVMYSRLDLEGFSFLKRDLDSGNKEHAVFSLNIKESGGMNVLFLDLPGGRILYSYDADQFHDSTSLMIADPRKGSKESLVRIVRDKGFYRIVIGDFTPDRKTVLANVWNVSFEKIGEKWSNIIEKIQVLDCSKSEEKPGIVEIIPSQNLKIKKCILSRDGSYVVYVEGTPSKPDNDTVMVYDRKTSKSSVLFSNKSYAALSKKPPLLFMGYSLASVPGGMALSDNNILLVWFDRGYFTINLAE